ncbi:MAG: carbohydrate ABC transporter permease [Clostridia bacterium]|nr:carbohydrate ABC transporter permease [Clostridia bacterium]
MRVESLKVKKASTSVLVYAFRYLTLLCFSYALLYPFVFMGINSVKNPTDWFDPTVSMIPKSISFDNIIVAFKYLEYPRTMWFTFLNCIIPALLSFFTCAVAGYGLARFKFKGRGILNTIMIICIMIPDPLIIIPSYANFMHLDFLGILGWINDMTGVDLRLQLINTPFVFIIPALLATGLKNGLFIYIYSQFFKGLPKELEEAAWIDGAGPYKTFMRIVLPSSGASNITVLVFAVVWYWNDYYQAQIYLAEKFPISVALSNFNTNLAKLGDLSQQYFFTNATLMVACCLIAIAPILIFFLVMQRKFVQSIATCGIVG